MLRLFGIPESEIAETLRVAEGELGDLSPLEITTCLRRGEVEVVTRYEPGAEGLYAQLAEMVASRHGDTLFSADGSSVDDQVAALLRGPPPGAGRVVHRGADGGAADRARRVVGLRGGRGGHLRRRGQGRAARCGPRADRGPRRGVARGCVGDGRRRAGALRGGHRPVDHRDRRPRRGDRGQARGHGVLVRAAGATARRSPARRACRATGPRSATARPRWACTC